MKFVFFAIPAYGHFNAMLGIIQELVKRGHNVTVCNTREFEDKIIKAGAGFYPPPTSYQPKDFRNLTSGANIVEMSLDATELILPTAFEIISKEKPDCIVHDALSLWGKIVAAKTGISSVSFVPSVAINLRVLLGAMRYTYKDFLGAFGQLGRLKGLLERYRSLYQRMGLTPPFVFDIFSNTEKLNIVFTSAYIQVNRDSFDTSYKFVGPIIYQRDSVTIPAEVLGTKKPLIYIALGTVYNDRAEVYKQFIDAFGNKQYQLIVGIGKYINRTDLGNIPDNVYIQEYIPQLEVLKKADVFISHGGMNSVNESLYFGVPMLFFPTIQEQQFNAARVEALGAGIYCRSKNISKEKLVSLVDTLLTDRSYKKNAEKIGKTLKNGGGAKMTIQLIEQYINF